MKIFKNCKYLAGIDSLLSHKLIKRTSFFNFFNEQCSIEKEGKKERKEGKRDEKMEGKKEG